MNYTEHIAGPVTGDVQRCSRCGSELLSSDVRFFGRQPWFPTGGCVYQRGGHRINVRPVLGTIDQCSRARRRGVRGRLVFRYNVRTDAAIEIPERSETTPGG